MEDTLQRIIKFKPAFDKRDSEPSKNYGIHNMEMFMVLKGPLGAISFTVYTGWYLEHLDIKDFKPQGGCICYHSPHAQYEDQSISEAKCEFLDNKPCYCDCSYIAADYLFHKFVAEGEDTVWIELQNRYEITFMSKVE